MEERILTNKPVSLPEEQAENSIRPQNLNEFIGQEKIKENLAIFIAAARKRKEPLDHCLFYSPPGLGKTTLANIIAHEMGVNIKVTSGPVLEKAGDLAAILTNLSPGDVLFIDEIHRLNRVVEESLYPVIEDFKFDIIIGSRFCGNSTYEISYGKKIAITVFKMLIKLFTGFNISDPTSGLQGLSRKAFEFYSKAHNFPEDYPDADVLIKMLKLGYKAVELPANIRKRAGGKSMHTGIKPLFYMCKISFSILVVLFNFYISNLKK